MMEGFCEDCARHQGQWFDGHNLFVHCAKRGIIKRNEINSRCDVWLARTSTPRDLSDKSQGTLFRK